LPTLDEIRNRFRPISHARVKLLTMLKRREQAIQADLDSERTRLLSVMKQRQYGPQVFIPFVQDALNRAAEELIFEPAAKRIADVNAEIDMRAADVFSHIKPPRCETKSIVAKDIQFPGPIFGGGLELDVHEGSTPQVSVKVNAQANKRDEGRFTLLVDGSPLGYLVGTLRVHPGVQEVASWTWLTPPLRGGRHTFNLDMNLRYTWTVSVELQVVVL